MAGCACPRDRLLSLGLSEGRRSYTMPQEMPEGTTLPGHAMFEEATEFCRSTAERHILVPVRCADQHGVANPLPRAGQ
jgi:hypothetical protein